MKIKCKNCLPVEGIEIPDFKQSEKLKLNKLAKFSTLSLTKYILENYPVNHRDAKYIVTHINKTYGHCNRCNFDNLNKEYIHCPKCGALNFNWQIEKEQDFDFFKTTMPASRKADFYLGCLEGSVFIDLNYTVDKRIGLCRISFDGYGCCNIENKAKCLDSQLSKDFIDEIAKDNFNQEKIAKIVLELIRLNKDNIWTDALEEYNLIEN